MLVTLKIKLPKLVLTLDLILIIFKKGIKKVKKTVTKKRPLLGAELCLDREGKHGRPVAYELDDDEILLTTREASAYLRLGYQTLVNDRLNEQTIPFRRLGKRAYRYLLSDLKNYIKGPQTGGSDA
tara:strand:+ start:126 stop:503 length:378 start_codon:yes stop_codon:yes gene_type:complete